MMEVPIAVFVIAVVLAFGGAIFAGFIFIALKEGELVSRERIHGHEFSCYSNYQRKLGQYEKRIRHLESVLRRVPVDLRSRRVKKIVGESR